MKPYCRLLSSKCFLLWDTVISTLFSTVVEFHVLFICCYSDGHIVILIPTHSWIALKSVWLCDQSLHLSYLCWTSMVLKTEHFVKQYIISASELIISQKLMWCSCLLSSSWILQVILCGGMLLSSEIISLLLLPCPCFLVSFHVYSYISLDVKTFAIFFIFLIILLCAFL